MQAVQQCVETTGLRALAPPGLLLEVHHSRHAGLPVTLETFAETMVQAVRRFAGAMRVQTAVRMFAAVAIRACVVGM